MSYTTLYAVGESGEVRDYAEFRNSHGSAAFVWWEMGDRYIGKDAYPKCMGSFGDDGGGMQRIWNLWKDPSLPLHQRAVMASTFDHVMVRAADFVRLAADMEAFVVDFPSGDKSCSLPEQAASLRELALDSGVRAACWQQTSVAADLWYVHGEDDEDEGRPYNIDVDAEHWFLYEALDALPTGAAS